MGAVGPQYHHQRSRGTQGFHDRIEQTLGTPFDTLASGEPESPKRCMEHQNLPALHSERYELVGDVHVEPADGSIHDIATMGRDAGQEQTFMYRAFGLNLLSEVDLPELVAAALGQPDVEIRLGPVPAGLLSPIRVRPRWEAAESRLLLKIDGVARILVAGGRRITVASNAGVAPRLLRLHLLGSAMGAVLQQRGRLPLHANAIAGRGGVVLVCGRSGSGKSTTAAALDLQGYPILSDDVCALEIAPETVNLHPSYPQLKLWESTLNDLNLPIEGLEHIGDHRRKFLRPVQSGFHTRPTPVKALVWLVETTERPSVALESLQGAQRFVALQRNTYRRKFLVGDAKRGHFELCHHALAQMAMYRLFRPHGVESVRQVADHIKRIADHPRPSNPEHACLNTAY